MYCLHEVCKHITFPKHFKVVILRCLSNIIENMFVKLSFNIMGVGQMYLLYQIYVGISDLFHIVE